LQTRSTATNMLNLPSPARLPDPRRGTTVHRWHSIDPAPPTAADIDAAARRPRRRGFAHAARHPRRCSTISSARGVFLKAETLQRTGSFKFRGAYKQALADPAGAACRRRGRLFLRQPRPGGGGGRAAPRHARGHRDAVGRAAAETLSAPRRSAPRSCSTTVTARTAPRSPAPLRRERGAVLVPPFDRSDDHCRAGHRRPRGRGRPGGAWAQARGGDHRASGGGLAAGIAIAVKARVPQAKLYTAEPEGFDDTPPARSAAATRKERAHERDDLRRPDDQYAGRDHISDQQGFDWHRHHGER